MRLACQTQGRANSPAFFGSSCRGDARRAGSCSQFDDKQVRFGFGLQLIVIQLRKRRNWNTRKARQNWNRRKRRTESVIESFLSALRWLLLNHLYARCSYAECQRNDDDFGSSCSANDRQQRWRSIRVLGLKSDSPRRWLAQVDGDLVAVLVDHAHCEKKAAGTAMNLIFAYGSQTALARELADIVVEELDHFRQVLDLLERRGLKFRPQKPSNYGRQLHEMVRGDEPGRAVDRLLIASLIEARSCERFSLLADNIAARDAELAAFYRSLFESEARHHSTYVRLANLFAAEVEVRVRLGELSTAEAAIIAVGDDVSRMHS